MNTRAWHRFGLLALHEASPGFIVPDHSTLQSFHHPYVQEPRDSPCGT
jgi:hypothetical protein